MEAHKSIWDKTEEELTVGDQYKLAIGVTVAVTAASVALWAGVAGAVTLWEKRQIKKANKRNQEEK